MVIRCGPEYSEANWIPSHTRPSDFHRHLSGGNLGFDIHEDGDGNFLMVGVAHLFGQGNGDAYLVKFDGDGEHIWSKTYGGIGTDMTYSILDLEDGSYAMAGLTESFGISARGGYCLRINEVGDTMWSRTMSNSFIGEYISLARADNDDIFAAGSTFNGVDGSSDFRLTRLTVDGDFVWERTFGGAQNEFCAEMIETDDGGLMLVGTTESFGLGGRDAFCVKLDGEGNLQWSKAYGGNEFDGASHIAKADNGSMVLTGFTSSGGNGQDDVLVMKIDSVGELLWSKAFGGSQFDYGRQILVDSLGGIKVAAFGNSFDVEVDDWFVDNDIWLLGLDEEGNGACTQVDLTLVDTDCNTIEGSYDASFVSGSGTHTPPTLVGATYLIELDACAPIGIDDESEPIFKLYPNPASSWLTIESGGTSFAYEVYNSVGKLVARGFGGPAHQIDVSDYPTGIYVIKCSADGQSLVRSLLIQ
jgi:hypothetical protein